MRVQKKGGQYYVDQIGLPEPLVLPGSMEEQDVVRAVLSKFGDEARAEQQRMKMINSTPPRDVLGIPGSGQAMRDVGPGLENFMLGAGRTGEMLWDFMQKPRARIGLDGISAPRPEDVAPYEQRAADRAMIGPQLEEYGGDPAFYGEMAPYFAPPAGAASRPIAGLMERLGVNRMPGVSRLPEMVGRSIIADTAGQGAVIGAASDEGSAVEGAAYGAGGGFLGQALSRALRPFDNSLDPATAGVLRRGEDLGYKLTPAQASGSSALARWEDAIENNLLMGGGLERISAANQANSNRIVAESLGFTGPRRTDKITPAMLDDVADRFNRSFDNLTQGQSVRVDSDDFIDALARLESENVDYPLYNKDFQDVINRTLDLIVKNDGWLTGEQYQTLSSKLVKGIRAGYKPGSGQADFAGQLVDLKDALDDAAMASLGSDVLDRFRSVRQDYKTFSNLMKNSVINEDTGDVSLRQLGNVLRRDDRYGYRRGKNTSDLYDATRFTRATVGDGVNSLTARRQSLPNVMMGSLAAGGLMYGASEDPSYSVGTGLAIPASMYMLGKFYNSPPGRQYFGKGLLPPISDEFRRHLGQRIGNATAGASAQGLLPAIPAQQ